MKGQRLKWFGHIKRREEQTKLEQYYGMTTRREETERETKNFGYMWHKTRPREIENFKLIIIGARSWKLKSNIDRGGENSYRAIMKS